MRVFKLTTLAVLLMGVSGFWWGKYQSEAEARIACESWRDKNKAAVISRMNVSPPVRVYAARMEYEKSLREINSSDRPENSSSSGYIGGPGTITKELVRQYAKEAYISGQYSEAREFDIRKKEFDKKADMIGYFSCRQEESTRQFLGVKGKSGQPSTIVKHFRY